MIISKIYIPRTFHDISCSYAGLYQTKPDNSPVLSKKNNKYLLIIVNIKINYKIGYITNEFYFYNQLCLYATYGRS